MKLLKHEAALFIVALIFLLAISFLNLSPTPETITENPEENATPYLVNINTADANELALLDGIGEKLAERIVDYRNQHGNFRSVSDLCRVSGIGTAVLNNIEEFATT